MRNPATLIIIMFLGNGMDQSANGSHRIIIQRSQSLQQPSTSNHHYQNIAAATAVPTTRVQQKQFFLNNYTSLPTNHNNNNNNNNHSILNVLNNTKLNPNIPATADSSGVNYNPPLKIFRINSSPATATITSAEHRQQQQQQKQSLAPLEFPIKISYNMDGSSTSGVNSPSVKIDYCNLTMPATSPSIKIDLSHFSAQLASSSSSSSSSSNKAPVQPSSNVNMTMPSSSTGGSLDEDYDT